MGSKLSFKEYISENFKNFIGKDSIDDRMKYADQVWSILQSSYAIIGGIKGSGFESKHNMMNSIPFWKLFISNGKVLVAKFYKDSNGRKLVAIATDGSDKAKRMLVSTFISELGIAYGEKSKASLNFTMKNVPFDILKNFLIPIELVSTLTGDVCTPATKYDLSKLDASDQSTFKRYTQLRDYFYVRTLGGKDHLKVAIGTPEITIK